MPPFSRHAAASLVKERVENREGAADKARRMRGGGMRRGGERAGVGGRGNGGERRECEQRAEKRQE